MTPLLAELMSTDLLQQEQDLLTQQAADTHALQVARSRLEALRLQQVALAPTLDATDSPRPLSRHQMLQVAASYVFTLEFRLNRTRKDLQRIRARLADLTNQRRA